MGQEHLAPPSTSSRQKSEQPPFLLSLGGSGLYNHVEETTTTSQKSPKRSRRFWKVLEGYKRSPLLLTRYLRRGCQQGLCCTGSYWTVGKEDYVALRLGGDRYPAEVTVSWEQLAALDSMMHQKLLQTLRQQNMMFDPGKTMFS